VLNWQSSSPGAPNRSSWERIHRYGNGERVAAGRAPGRCAFRIAASAPSRQRGRRRDWHVAAIVVGSVDPGTFRRPSTAPNGGAWPQRQFASRLFLAAPAGPPRGGKSGATATPVAVVSAAPIPARSAARATRRTAAPGHRRVPPATSAVCAATRPPRRRAAAAAGTPTPLPRCGHRCQQPRSQRVPPPRQRSERGRLAATAVLHAAGLSPCRAPRRGPARRRRPSPTAGSPRRREGPLLPRRGHRCQRCRFRRVPSHSAAPNGGS
jgi:hypothetical protein